MAADEDEEEDDFFDEPVKEVQKWEQPSGADSGVDDLLTKFTIYLLQCGNGTNYVKFMLPRAAFLEALRDPRSVIADANPERSYDQWILADKVTDFSEGWH